jgi:hypothetical protein
MNSAGMKRMIKWLVFVYLIEMGETDFFLYLFVVARGIANR